MKKTADCAEQIDLLVKLGTLLVVGEIKCFLTPVDSFEHHMHFKKLHDATKQAKRKAAYLRGRPDIVAKALAIAPSEAESLRILPLVVVNQGFGFSLLLNECRIADAEFLKLFLSHDEMITGMLFHSGKGAGQRFTTKLYSSLSEAQEEFEKVLGDPPTLRRFKAKVGWKRTQFPAEGSKAFFIQGAILGSAPTML